MAAHLIHYRKAERDFYYFVNEGETIIEGDFSLSVIGALEYWNPLDGSTQPWPAVVQGGRLHTHLQLVRRAGVILMVDPQAALAVNATSLPLPGSLLMEVTGPWQAYDVADQPLDLPCPGDWARQAGWETFAGRLSFRTIFTLTAHQATQPLFLELGQVGDIAEVLLNNTAVGVCAWAPYILRIDAHTQAGPNRLEVWVTNSIANYYEGIQAPSGLVGPVQVRLEK